MKLVLVILCYVAVALSASCDPLKGMNSFNPDCSSIEEAYCRLSGTDWVCAQCLSHCDCSTDEYCSSEPGDNFGKCVKFEKAGKECRPLTNAQLNNADYPEEWKCAALYDNGGVITVDFRGECIDMKCRICNPRTNTNGCDPQDGLETERECAYPGVLVNTHTAPWYPGNYYESPLNVWFALFFCLIMLILITQCITIIFARR